MSRTDDKMGHDEVSQKFGEPSSVEKNDPAYEAWAEKKITDALAHDRANPETRLTQGQVWKKFGLAH